MGQKSLAIPLPAPSPTSTLQRRWSQTQAKDFHDLHTTLATLILQCDLQDADAEVQEADNRGRLATPSDVTAALYGQNSVFYLQVFSIQSITFLHVYDTVIFSLRN